jgi:ABC-type branched-subunit amino acid transport system ATPase component
MTALLRTEGVSVRFGGLTAVNAVDVAIPRGAIHGIIGPSGAGKTTFFNAITGLVQTSSGRIAFDGVDITAEPTFVRARRGMRRTFQSVQLIPQLTVLENVLIGLSERNRLDTLRSLVSPSGRDPAEEAAQDRVVEVLEFLGIADTLFKRPRELSFAEQRYVEIARALVSRPKLLMFDEPAAGLSPTEVQGLNGLLRRFRERSAVTIILVEHVLSLVFDVSDRITVFENGRVIAEGPPAEVEADPKVKAAYLGDGDA